MQLHLLRVSVGQLLLQNLLEHHAAIMQLLELVSLMNLHEQV